MKFCPYCGSGMNLDMRFCPSCGMPFEGGKENPNITTKDAKQKDDQGSAPIQTAAVMETRKRKGRKRVWPFIVVLFFVVALSGFYIRKVLINKPFSDNADAISKAAQSVVKLNCYDRDGELLATGSGFVAFEKDVIVTNYHVIEEAYRITVQTESEVNFEVPSVVAYDAEKDLAILRADRDTGLQVLPLGVTTEIMKGAKVVAIGSPLGLINSVSTGIYSGFVVEEGQEYLQFSASISSGSSGGALFNEKGEVIGITSASYIEGQNLNLAIPVERVIAMWDSCDHTLMLSIDDFYNRSGHIKTYSITEMLSQSESYRMHLYETCRFKGYVSSIEYSQNVPWLIYLVSEKDQVSGKTYDTSDLDEIKGLRNSGKISPEEYLSLLSASRNPDEDAVHSYALRVSVDNIKNIGAFSTGDYVCVTGALDSYPDNIGPVMNLLATELIVMSS